MAINGQERAALLARLERIKYRKVMACSTNGNSATRPELEPEVNKLKKFILRRVVMSKFKAFFGGLKDPTTSEFWLGWGALIIKGVTLAAPPAAAILSTVAEWVGFPSGAALIGTVLAYVAARMTSKAAKAKAE